MAVFLGLDSSTQSLSAIAIDFNSRQVVLERSINFEERLPQFGCRDGVLPSDDPAVAHADPLMWLAALDLLLGEIRASGFDLGRVQAISGAGQQHGSVYLQAAAAHVLAALDDRPLDEQLRPVLARKTSPIWMDSSTARQCAEIEQALGGADRVAQLTGSRCFERFTGPQIRKFWQQEENAYRQTARIHLVSSFMASVLAGRHAPIDHGDGAGMNLMDIRHRTWSREALDATAAGLPERVGELAASDTVLGPVSPYFVRKYGFSPAARAVAWTGDNPSSLIGVGLIAPGKVCISLGTSDTYFGFMPEPNVSPHGEGHVFASPTGDYMSLICFLNGSLTREDVKGRFGLSWDEFSRVLRGTRPGNDGKVLLPYYRAEITPHVPSPQVRRYRLAEDDMPGHVRGVVEAQMASMAIHSRWMGVATRTIHATGGASANRDILQVMADVHNAEVYQFQVSKSAALGAALRAAHAAFKSSGRGKSWSDIVRGFAEPVAASRVARDPATAGVYREFLKRYEACEQHALRGGPDPMRDRPQTA